MDIDDLRSDAERRLWAAFSSGDEVDLGTEDPTAPDFDPSAWAGQRTVRAEVISYLLLGGLAPEPGRIAKVYLAGARIVGRVVLNGGVVRHELLLTRCWFEHPLDLTDARTRVIQLDRCVLPGVDASRLRVRGAFDLVDCRVVGTVAMSSARVGSLDLSGSTVEPPEGQVAAVDAAMMRVAGIFISGGLTLHGSLVLTGASVNHLAISSSRIGGRSAIAILAAGLITRGTCGLTDLRCQGDVMLSGSNIGTSLSLVGLTIDSTHAPWDSQLDSLATIMPDKEQLDGLRPYFRDYAPVAAPITLAYVRVGGAAILRHITISDRHELAVAAAGMSVGADLDVVHLEAAGSVDLGHSVVGGSVRVAAATVRQPFGMALYGNGLTVRDTLAITGRSTFEGVLDLSSVRADVVRIEEQVVISSGTSTVAGMARRLLDLGGAQARTLALMATVHGRVDLRGARFDSLVDDAVAGPPTRLDGLVYESIEPDDIKSRLRWLRKDPDKYKSQPYVHLASYYRKLGRSRDVRQVLLRERRASRRHEPSTWKLWPGLRVVAATVWRLPRWLFDGLAGYGYVPLRAFSWLLAAWVFGWWVFRTADLPAPTANSDVNAVLYSLDAIVPTSPLGLEDTFTPHGWPVGVLLALKVLGYALSIAVLPAVTRALSRSDSDPLG